MKNLSNPMFELTQRKMENDIYKKQLEKYSTDEIVAFDVVAELISVEKRDKYSSIVLQNNEKGDVLYETNMPYNYWFDKENKLLKIEGSIVKGGANNNADLLIVLRGNVIGINVSTESGLQLSSEEYKKFENLTAAMEENKKNHLYSLMCNSKGKKISDSVNESKSIARFTSEVELKAAYEVMKDCIPNNIRHEIERCFDDLRTGSSDEKKVAKKVLTYLLNFKWIYEEETYDVDEIMSKVNETHVGMEGVKETFKKVLISYNNSNEKRPEVICLAGREACGKTSIAEAFFKAMGKSYSKLSVSGMDDALSILGSSRNYDNGRPSPLTIKYLEGRPDAGFIIDEIDKASPECVNALLSFIDREFRDEFIEVPLDLSRLFIICTANDIKDINPALLRRMTVVNVEEYTTEEKIAIIREILIPRMCKKYDIKQDGQNFSRAVCEKIIKEYAGGESIATVERIVNDIFVKGFELNQRFPDIGLSNFNDFYSVDDEKNMMMNVYARDFGSLKRKIQVCNSMYPENVQKKNVQMIDRIIHGTADNKEYALNVLRVTGNIIKGKKVNIDINKIKTELDASHYGMNKCKTAIQNYFVDMLVAKNKKSKAILLDGPAGCGKTSIAMSIAKALGLKYKKISVNGVSQAEAIKGFRHTFKNSEPGKIAMALADEQICSYSVVLLIDEIDKMCCTKESDPYTAFYDLLDNQGGFYDEYLDVLIPTDNILFIFSSNDMSKLPEPLVDRMEVIRLDGYSCYEKKIIARSYVLPKVVEDYKLKEVSISDETLSLLVKNYCISLGVRDLELAIENIVKSKIKEAMMQGTYGDNMIINIKGKDIKDVMGEKHNDADIESVSNRKQYGKARALAVTGSCGTTFDIQITDNEYGEDDIITGLATGSFLESIKVVKTLVCNRLKKEMPNVHIHAMSAGIEKDGPSAGITMYACMMSYMLKKPIDNCAFTGEIDLFGFVSAIGGLKAKLAAAERAGIERVFIPRRNYEVLMSENLNSFETLEIIPINHVNELDDILFNEMCAKEVKCNEEKDSILRI